MTATLASTYYIDHEHRSVREFAARQTNAADDDAGKAVKLFYAVRDEIRYDPYTPSDDPRTYRASHVLATGRSFCIPKATLLCAAARAVGIPARLGFADVRNHLNTERLRRLMETDEFVYHGYTALRIGSRWLKVTPAFNVELCDRFDVRPLEFDGLHDAMLHPVDRHARRHMEYLRDHGTFDDLPFERIVAAFRRAYPKFWVWLNESDAGGFEDDTPLR
jgi:transglutaminase-like putative cysteine protease